MAEIVVSNSSLGNSLIDLLMADEIEPGDDPSYQICKTIYLYHPLGGKMIDSPIRAAQSQAREIAVPDAPDCVTEAFLAEWKRMKADETIANGAGVSRIYGVGSVVLGAVGKAANIPLDPEELWRLELFFNVIDPLNSAGSIVLNQDPNSPIFQKHAAISVSGEVWHRSRCCVMMNEKPIYIAYTSSGFGYVGRSVYQRALFPLKTFVQTMITDDMVTQKAGLLIAKIQPAGSITDRMMQGFNALKRSMLQGAKTGNVLSISAGTTSSNAEEIATLNMMNVDGAGGWARGNVLKNIATAADMPAVMLENETLTEGFGEGSEDAKIIARYIDGVREWMAPLYEFMDPVVQRRAWNPEWYKTLQRRYPDQYGDVDYKTAFYSFVNAFTAVWPNLLKEPESEAVKVEKEKHDGLIGALEVLLPIADPVNKAILAQWFADNMNKNKLMFSTPLTLDTEALEAYEPPTPNGEKEPAAPNEARSDSAPMLRRLTAA